MRFFIGSVLSKQVIALINKKCVMTCFYELFVGNNNVSKIKKNNNFYFYNCRINNLAVVISVIKLFEQIK
jgi:hypothetical protein